MANHDAFEYDIALSFADQDKVIAEEIAALLRAREISVFLDEYKSGDLWGKDVLDHFVNLYARKARYCVILISQFYPLRTWTIAERTAVQQRALRDTNEYIVPLQLDDTDVPGVAETTAYRDLRQHSITTIVDLLEQKLSESRSRSGPPSQSHDLRSGNVPGAD